MLLQWCCHKSSWLVCFCTTNTLPWSQPSQLWLCKRCLISLSPFQMWLLCWQTAEKKAVADAPERPLDFISTFMNDIWGVSWPETWLRSYLSEKFSEIFHLYDMSAMIKRLSPDLPVVSGTDGTLLESCRQGFGANHFFFCGSRQTAPRRLFHGIPEASLICQENISKFTANIMRHLHSEWCFCFYSCPPVVYHSKSGRLRAIRKIISALS